MSYKSALDEIDDGWPYENAYRVTADDGSGGAFRGVLFAYSDGITEADVIEAIGDALAPLFSGGHVNIQKWTVTEPSVYYA